MLMAVWHESEKFREFVYRFSVGDAFLLGVHFVTSGFAVPVKHEDISLAMVKHRGYLTAYVWSMVRDEHLVEDILQEAAVVAIRRMSDIEDKASVVPWLRSTCRLLALSALRKRAKSPTLLNEAAFEQLEAAWAKAPIESDQSRIEALKFCLTKLNTKAKALIRLRYIEGYDASQIAQHQGIKTTSVYMAMSRIMKRLRDCVQHQQAQSDRPPTEGGLLG